MLVSFSLQNHRSFADEMTLDFRIPTEGKSEEELKYLDENPYVKKINGEYISKLCILYGANGSGKSNLLKALQSVLWGNIEDLLDPFMIENLDLPIKYTLEFYENSPVSKLQVDKRQTKKIPKYYYEIILDNQSKSIKSEIFKEVGGKIFLERTESQVSFTPEKNFSINDTSTVFSFIKKTKVLREQKDLSRYFDIFVSLIPSQDFSLNVQNNTNMAEEVIGNFYDDFKSNNIWNIYKKLLILSDTGLEDLEFKQNLVSIQKLAEDLQELNEKSKENPHPLADMLKKQLQHMIDAEKDVFQRTVLSKRQEWIENFDSIESDGTKAYAIHLTNIVLSIYCNCISIHDEFNGLQSELIEMMLTLFQNDRFLEIKDSTNQLIIATHDTNIMSAKYLLVDHIWFVNKKNHKSELYCAGDFEEVTIKNVEDKYKNNKLRAKYRSLAYAVPDRFLEAIDE